MAIGAVAIVVPAHNEADTIVACLRSVQAAIHRCRPDLSFLIVVSCDACDDGTAALARAVLGDAGLVVEGAWPSVGRVRAAATDAALRAMRFPAEQIWLANTDADSTVTPTWLTTQLALAAAGWAAVTGIVELYRPDPALAQEFAGIYEIHPDGTHHHVHGANLGVRADAYLAAGGWPPLGLAEDHAMLAAVRAQGWPITSSASVRVRTSARLHGRAPDGFAATLRRLDPTSTVHPAMATPSRSAPAPLAGSRP